MQFNVKMARFWLAAASIGLLSACGHLATAQRHSGEISLSLAGYNYTNRYIDSFSVDGQGGGNIYVSSPTSGGGGTVCCVSYFPRAPQQTVRVRWTSGGCYFSEKSSLSDEMVETLHSFYKEEDVPVEVLAKDNAQHMEVHFYLDGTIKAAITAGISPPRMMLDKRREDRSRYPRSPADRKPEK